MQVKIVDRFKGLNSIIKFVIIQIIIVLVLWFYFKGAFGIYKHKYVNQLEKREKEFKERLKELKTQKQVNIKKVFRRTKKLKKDVSKIEKKRIEDNKIIDNSDISDTELERFLSKHQQKKR